MALQRPPRCLLRARAVLRQSTRVALQRQRPAPSQRLPYRTTLDRCRPVAATAPHRPPAFPLRLRAVLRQAVMATALHRQHPDRPQRLRSRVTLLRWSPVAAMALQRPPRCLLCARAVLRQLTRVALQRQRPAPSQRLPYRTTLERWRAVPATAPHRPPASPLRLRAAVLGRWGATALHRPP